MTAKDNRAEDPSSILAATRSARAKLKKDERTGNGLDLVPARSAENGLPAIRYFPLMEPLARIFVIVGIIFVALGAFLHFGPSVPLLGKLPGDIRVERPGFRFYFPITSSLLLSVVVSGVVGLLSKFR